MIDARFGAYLAVSALLIILPGPDMALVTRNALHSGRHAASMTALGVAVGTLGWVAASAIGVGVLLERSVMAFTALKLAGALYLAYLGVRSLLHGFLTKQPTAGPPSFTSRTPLKAVDTFKQGILCNLLNPKAAVIFVTILPQFTRPGDPAFRLVLMVVAFEVMLLLWLNLYGALISRAGQSRTGLRLRTAMERVTGVVLIGLGVRLAVEGR